MVVNSRCLTLTELGILRARTGHGIAQQAKIQAWPQVASFYLGHLERGFLEYGMARLVRVLQLGDCYDTAFVAVGEIALARANAGHRSWKVLRQACDDVETRVQPNGPRA